MAYRVDVPKDVLRFLERLAKGSPSDYLRIDAAIETLSAEPRPRGAKKLSGRGPLYRLRVGEYRIIYAVFDPDRLVTVEDVKRKTSNTYKKR